MFITTRFNDRAKHAPLNPASCFSTLKYSLLAAILLVVLAPQVLAQVAQDTWMDIGEGKMKYQLDTQTETLSNGQSFAIQLFFEAPESALCYGVEYELGLSPLVHFDTATPWSVPATSWLGNAADLTLANGESPGSQVIFRTDEVPQSGSGWVLSAHLVVGATPVAASEVVQALDGGLIFAENIDLKKPWSAAVAESVQVYPNPFSDHLRVEAGPLTVHIRILDAMGNLLQETTMVGSGILPTDDLPPGLYLIQSSLEGDPAPKLHRMVK